jgi:hypothetical protein
MPLTTGAICFTLSVVVTGLHGAVALMGLEFALLWPPNKMILDLIFRILLVLSTGLKVYW